MAGEEQEPGKGERVIVKIQTEGPEGASAWGGRESKLKWTLIHFLPRCVDRGAGCVFKGGSIPRRDELLVS